MNADRNGKKKGSGVISTLILIIALCVFLYSGYRLFTILYDYAAAKNEYNGLQEEFTTPYEEEEEMPPDAAEDTGAIRENTEAEVIDPTELPEEPYVDENGNVIYARSAYAAPPLSIDWDKLKAINSEIVGWIYMDAIPGINYPVLRAADNEYYLHHTFRREYLFAGSIFMDYYNEPDFTDPNTILYGHNMRNGSMFGRLSDLEDKKLCDEKPYFWIMTPEADFRYEIYSVMETPVGSAAYSFFETNRTEEFLDWEQRMKDASWVERDVALYDFDRTVTLSTCTGDSSVRCVVMGKLVWAIRHETELDDRADA